MPRLTEQEQQEIIRFLEADKPLPEKYRFLLFQDKREVELVWNGKSSEVCNIVLPFQVIEQVDEPRAEKDTRLQMSMFDLDARGRQLKGWTNKLIWGDNKLILSSLKNGPLREEIERQGGLKLIYIDPPFDVGADSFITMIYERLALMRDLLAEDGSIYVHCDWRLNSLIRQNLDDISGRDGHVNEIIWHYTGEDVRRVHSRRGVRQAGGGKEPGGLSQCGGYRGQTARRKEQRGDGADRLFGLLFAGFDCQRGGDAQGQSRQDRGGEGADREGEQGRTWHRQPRGAHKTVDGLD